MKVVSTARSLADNLAVLHLIEDRSLSAHVVGIAMGEEGLVSRVLGPRAGAAFTFASVSDGAETAPGQLTARTLRDLYRVEHLDQATRIFGVAGNPVSHSLSPLLHNTAFRREGVNAVLLPLKVRVFADLLTLARELPLAGVAVTMPLKQEVLPHLANMDPLTARIAAWSRPRRQRQFADHVSRSSSALHLQRQQHGIYIFAPEGGGVHAAAKASARSDCRPRRRCASPGQAAPRDRGRAVCAR